MAFWSFLKKAAIVVAVAAVVGAFVGPLLALAGFSAAGPASGSAAATWMASAGTVPAGGVYATLQSAAMGGYGYPVVAWALKGVAASIDALFVFVGGKGGSDAGGEDGNAGVEKN